MPPRGRPVEGATRRGVHRERLQQTGSLRWIQRRNYAVDYDGSGACTDCRPRPRRLALSAARVL